MALQSSQRLPELLFYTKKSYRILQLQFQLQFYKGTHTSSTSTDNLHVYTTSREFSIQNPILHAEDKELFDYYYYIQRAKRPSFQKRNSTHRRQRDLLEMHPCVTRTFQAFQLQDLPRHSSHYRYSRHSSLSSLSRHSSRSRQPRDIPDIPVIHDLPASPGNSTSSSTSRVSTPFQHSPIRMHILQFDWFPQKLHRVPVEQYKLQTFYKHYILQRKGDVVISVNFISVKMSR